MITLLTSRAGLFAMAVLAIAAGFWAWGSWNYAQGDAAGQAAVKAAVAGATAAELARQQEAGAKALSAAQAAANALRRKMLP